jgi:hypothetical protein
LPAFNLSLRLTSRTAGTNGSAALQSGSEGMLSVGNDVYAREEPRPRDPGLSIESYPKAMRESFARSSARITRRAAE